jgi:hypothetical protein
VSEHLWKWAFSLRLRHYREATKRQNKCK